MGYLVKSQLMKEKCTEVSSILKAMAHPQRLMVMCHLNDGEKTVSELLELCDLSQSQLSQFLQRLQLEGLLQMRKEGQFSYYRIANKDICRLVISLQKIFCSE